MPISLIELMTVEISVSSMTILCYGAYGPQENSAIEKKDEFWKVLEEEAISAWISGPGFILQFDGNLWCGSDIIPGDPNTQNKNGKLFNDFLSRQTHLTVVNSLPFCEGLITRRRRKQDKIEESILDFFCCLFKSFAFC